MKNIEKYEQEISKLVNKGNSLSCAIAIAAGISNGNCFGCKCSDCHKKILEWMYSEYKEQIMTDEARDIVESMCDCVKKLGCEVNYVEKKYYENDNCYISIIYENHVIGIEEIINSPVIDNDKFKGMEFHRKYTLEDLGITCQTQKDNYVRQ